MDQSLAKEIADIPLFSDLEPEYIDFIANHANEHRIGRDELLFRQGERAEHFYLVRNGRVTLEVPAIAGPALEVQHAKAGTVLGWSWLIAPYKWTFNARAEEPTTVIEFDGPAILDRCERDAAFGYQILKRFSALMSERLDAARQRMIDQWNPPGFA